MRGYVVTTERPCIRHGIPPCPRRSRTVDAGFAQIVSTGDLAKRELAEMKSVAGEESSGKGAGTDLLAWRLVPLVRSSLLAALVAVVDVDVAAAWLLQLPCWKAFLARAQYVLALSGDNASAVKKSFPSSTPDWPVFGFARKP